MIPKKRALLALLLALSMLTVPACSDNAADTSGETAASNAEVSDTEITETIETEPEETEIPDNLPETDMDGWQFRMTIFGNDQTRAQTYAEELNGNVVNDAVYQKILNVEERFNVDISLTEASLASVDSVDVLKQSITAGDDSCEIAQGHDISMANTAQAGMFYNVYDIPHLDFEKPWWLPETLESMTVAGQMYMMFNNISYNNLAQTRVMFFNKDMMDEFQIEYPYETVREGGWTLDTLIGLSESAYIDKNGDGSVNADDSFGFVNGTTYYCWLEPFVVEPYKKDETGSLYYELDVDKISTITEKFYTLIFGTGGLKDGNAPTIFSDGRAMFFYQTLNTAVTTFSDSDVRYGLLPMPKLNEAQDQYYGGSTDRPIAVPITINTANLENLGIVVEALNAEGYKQVYPAYYEIAMKTRYADQTDDAVMLDIVHDNVIISFTYLYGNYASAYNILFENLFNANTPSTDVASWAASCEKAQTARVKSLMKFFSKHMD